MKKTLLILLILTTLFMFGCSVTETKTTIIKYQCQDNSVVDKFESCPIVKQSEPVETVKYIDRNITVEKNITIEKEIKTISYICNNGNVVEDSSECESITDKYDLTVKNNKMFFSTYCLNTGKCYIKSLAVDIWNNNKGEIAVFNTVGLELYSNNKLIYQNQDWANMNDERRNLQSYKIYTGQDFKPPIESEIKDVEGIVIFRDAQNKIIQKESFLVYIE